LQKDEGDPLVDRAISCLPPGSTFKLITALAGLRGTKNIAGAKYSCGGGVSYGDHFFRCWVAEKPYTHGNIGLMDAIKVSCDSFFYQYGNAAGIQSIDHIGKMLGIGEESGLHLSGEQSGNMPGPEWMQIHHPQERWSQAQTANVSIGQGYTLVSPLQLAMAYATIANGGICYYPRLVDKVLKQDGSPVLDEHGNVAVPQTPQVRSDLRKELSPDKIELVRKGLWKVVNEDGGTGGRARLKDVQVTWLSPAHKANPFQMLKDVNYAGGNIPSGDEENADESQNATAQMASSDAAPDVEPEADSRGQVRRRAAVPAGRAVPAAAPQP